MATRGALIVLEGCDKAGKSTHVKLLLEALKKLGKKASTICFPERTTGIGQMIDKYLKCETELQDESIHLLFAANRWELQPKIEKMLMGGESVIVDRYAFSGVAFSSAKGLELNWCKGPDVGLPKPDSVIFLDIPEEAAAGRGEYGQERYESLDFQGKVRKRFFDLMDDSWKVISSNRPILEVHLDILEAAVTAISCCEEGKAIEKLWV